MRLIVAIGFIALLLFGCSTQNKEKALRRFIEEHVAKIKPLEKAEKEAYWKAATTGSDSAYKKDSELKLKIRRIYANRDEFNFLKELKEKKEIKDPVLSRQLTVLYNRYLENQIDSLLTRQIVELSNKIEEKFSTFRPTLNGKKVTNNEILKILKEETDSRKRKAAWEASKQVGKVVADDIIKLVKLRNKAARQLGFDNYHTMSLKISEQDVKQIDAVFYDLSEYSLEPYYQSKRELDRILAEKYKADPLNLKPWHYHDPFFQEAPQVYKVDLDAYYKNRDVKELARTFYAGIGLPVESILEKSDLYERDGKNPHAFCEDFDKEGDVRILCNLKNNESWMETILHELGHAVYDKYNNPSLPYLLREPAHIFTTEGVAMLFGRLSRNPYWMQKMLNLSDEERQKIEPVLYRYMRLKQLIFTRWTLVMYHFEKAMYANPDRNLNKLWWSLVKKYQLVNPPEGRDEPDWAAKIHFTIAPCYYHNYLLGELFASQLNFYISKKIIKTNDWRKVSFVNKPEVGTYLKEKVFKPGKLYPWNEMIKRATGSPLKADFFIKQFLL
ncbi:MAG: M2 family metallopeptidase [Calditrichaeota bacterium]|nr:M2 family metallopeptidase [Calditrichota bacterium]